MIAWLEWFADWQGGLGGGLLVLGFMTQWIAATTITSWLAPRHWGFLRFFLTTVFWPVALVSLVLTATTAKVQRILDRRRMSPIKAQMVVEDYIERNGGTPYVQQNREESISFWRERLQAESEIERECAVMMLTDVFEVPLDEPEPEPAETEDDPDDLTTWQKLFRQVEITTPPKTPERLLDTLQKQAEQIVETYAVPPAMYLTRCPRCRGTGYQRLLPAGKIVCSTCGGAGFRSD